MAEHAYIPPFPIRQDREQNGRSSLLDTLKGACKDLKPGQMVSVPELTLMDAMAAIQILDPRVDGGMEPIPAQLMAQCDQVPTQESSMHSFDVYAQLTVSDIIWIMDRMLACEAAWLESSSLSGASLSQTIHTCLYVHHLSSIHPNTTKTPTLVGFILRPFLIAILKTVGLVWDELAKGNILDGEDYMGDKAGVSLLEDLDPQNALGLLDNAMNWLDHNQDSIEENERIALLDRLSFRKHFLSAITLFSRMDPSTTFRRTTDIEATLHQSIGYIASAGSQIEVLSQGTTKLRQPDLANAPTSQSRNAFDPWFCRHASDIKSSYTPISIAPPQPLELNTPLETIRVYKTIFEGMQEFCLLAGSKQSWFTWKQFFDKKAISFQLNPAPPYVRSLWQSAVCTDTTIALTKPLRFIAISFLIDVVGVNVESIPQMIWGMPGISPDRATMLEKRLVRFLDRMSGQLVAHLRNLAQNRSRSKRRLGHSYSDLVALADEASTLGSELADTLGGKTVHPDLLFWAIQSLALDTMLHCIFSGIELELYRTEELLSVYWMTCQISKEQIELWSALSIWSNGSVSQSQDTMQSWTSIVYHTSRALYLLYNDVSGDMERGQRSWLGQPKDDQIQRTMFRKRFKWLQVRSQPQNIAKFWEAFREDVEMTHSAEIGLEERMREAKGDLDQAIVCCESMTSNARQPDHTITVLKQDLAIIVENLSVALRDDAKTNTAALGPCLIPLVYSSTSHPWFPSSKV
ncbi:uncharacterized protein FA14DRAFT_161357 [Meira miltonrushii]|uniref:Mak10-domain-containing protein n=1 Tax=Meira miltonrushii TaxID=1280837 RepID=A0A316V961_9BASI|nr:uncharacterized protein FA14DRAFT_161357 [Meira miltonrushii]PWN33578.1 hypothetical protein FA14DRAFT_161357 [Meira miltonrushii]